MFYDASIECVIVYRANPSYIILFIHYKEGRPGLRTIMVAYMIYITFIKLKILSML